jgi:hypothetical protein
MFDVHSPSPISETPDLKLTTDEHGSRNAGRIKTAFRIPASDFSLQPSAFSLQPIRCQVTTVESLL